MTSPKQASELLSSLRRQNDDLHDKIRIMQQSEEEALSEASTLRYQLSEANEDKKLLKDKLKECRTRLEDAVKVCERLKKRADKENVSPKKADNVDEIEALRSELKLQKVEIRLGEKKVKEAESRIKFLREVMIKKEKDKVEELEKKLESARNQDGTQLKDTFSALESKAKDLEKTVTEKDAQIKKLTDEKKALEEAHQLKENEARLEADMSDFKEKMRKLEEHLQRCEESLKNKETEMKALKRDGEEKASLQKDCEKLKHTCLEQQDQINDYQKLLAKTESNITELEEEKKTLRKECQRHQIRNDELEQKLKEVSSKYDGSLMENKELNKKLQGLKRDNEESRMLLDESTAETTKMRQELANLKQNLDDYLHKWEKLTDSTTELKEEVAEYKTENCRLKEALGAKNVEVDDLRKAIAGRERDIDDISRRLESTSQNLNQKDMENATQINQLKKLVDHLQARGEEKKGPGRSKKLDWALSYEELQEMLEEEKKKCQKLSEELQSLKKPLNTEGHKPLPSLRASSVHDFAKKQVLAETAHRIPHRFQKQTNVRSQKCSVCLGNIPFCKPISICKFCHRVAHPLCQLKVGDDCGLSTDLANILKDNESNTKDVSHRGFLRVPEHRAAPGKTWKKVPVQIVGHKLVIDDGHRDEINLRPDRGFVFIQSTVAFSELLHASVYERPNVFKIGFSSGSRVRESHYFLAKSFQEKAAWIEAIEKVTLCEKDKVANEVSSPSKSISKCEVLTSFPNGINVFCCLALESKKILFGTSNGLYLSDGGGKPSLLKGGPESVYNMRVVEDTREIMMIADQQKKLVVISLDSLLASFEGRKHPHFCNIELVASCHLFEVGRFREQVQVCAVDDYRVAIMARDRATGNFNIRYGFSTDQPPSAILFLDDSLLVMTDKIYKIDLDNFDVCEFVGDDSVFVENHLVDMFRVDDDGTKVLICFQDYGLFVTADGKTLSTIKWSSLSGQFLLCKNHLWLTFNNALECLDLVTKSRAEIIHSNNPHIVSTKNHEELIFVNKKSDLSVVMRYTMRNCK